MSDTSSVKLTARKPVTRRKALKRLAGAAGAGAAMLAMPAIWRRAHGAQQIVVAHPGGPYEQSHGEGFMAPFTKETGIEVVGVARRAAPAAQVKAMVETKSYQWDAVYVGFSEGDLLGAEGLLDKIDTTGADFAELPANMKNQFFSPTDVYATVLGYNKDKFGSNPPRTWADFWNVAKFPGRRSLGQRGYDTAEEAMMADGVPPGPKVYEALAGPGGWDRMFKKLDQIRPGINVWWKQPAESSQLIKGAEVDLIAVYNARAQVAIDAGAPFVLSWDQGLYDLGGYAIAKGCPKADLARKFIAYTANAKRQAVAAKYLAYGPSNAKAYDYLDKARAAILPTYPPNLKGMMQIDTRFWSKWKATANDKLNEWLLKG